MLKSAREEMRIKRSYAHQNIEEEKEEIDVNVDTRHNNNNVCIQKDSFRRETIMVGEDRIFQTNM